MQNARTLQDRAVVAAMVSAAAIMAQLVSGKATRDALFLSAFGPRALPLVMVAASVVSIVASVGSGRLMLRFSPASIMPPAFVMSGVLYVMAWVVGRSSPSAAASILYLHVAGLGAVLTSGFWSVVAERFDPHEAKRVVGRIAAGGSIGGIAGGLAAWQMASFLSVHTVILLLAGLNLVAAGGTWWFGRGTLQDATGSEASEKTGPVSALQILRSVPYTRDLAILVGLGSAAQALLDYVVSAHATAAFSKGDRLMTFFSLFYVTTGVLGLIGQAVFGRKSLEKLGLAGAVAILPATIAIGSAAAAAFSSLASVVMVRGAELVARNAVYRAGYELFYTPIAPVQKRPTKAFIDVAVDRIGTSVGSGLTMLVLYSMANGVDRVLMILSMLLAIVMGVVALRLRDGYVRTLADSLRSGTIKLQPQHVIDGTTLNTLTLTTASIDRQALLKEIERLRKTKESSESSATPLGNKTMVSPTTEPGCSGVLSLIADLESGDPSRIATVLRGEGLDPRCTAHLLPLLAHDKLARNALHVLRKMAPRIVGQLHDALLDPAQPLAIRRRVPRVLKVVPTRRAASGLVEGLSDPVFELRFACAQALFEMSAPPNRLEIAADDVYQLIRKEIELAVIQGALDAGQVADGDDDPGSSLHQMFEGARDRRVQYVFTLLSLILEREPLSLAFKATRVQDASLHGTALEYLENVLPRSVAESLIPLLEVTPRADKPNRSHQEVLEDLLKSRQSIELSLVIVRNADTARS